MSLLQFSFELKRKADERRVQTGLTEDVIAATLDAVAEAAQEAVHREPEAETGLDLQDRPWV